MTTWTAACQASLSYTIFQSILKFMSIESVIPSNHLIVYCALLLLPSIFPSIKVFSNELALHIRWPKHWGFCFSISPSNEYSRLISFRIDWLDLSAVRGILRSLLQHQNLKASILWRSAFLHHLIGVNQHPDSNTTENSQSPNWEKVSASIPSVRLLNWSFGGSHL